MLVFGRRAKVVFGRQPMADYSHILFNKCPAQLRLLGARGGRTFGRNQRLRRSLMTTPPEAVPLPAAPASATIAKAIALLDAQFPWLQSAEKPRRLPRGGELA